jgi:MoaA/NifB/PqqE/SkfB family radical SAM enzyme
MFTASLARLGVKHVSQTFSEKIYIFNQMDFTRPLAIRGSVNERCNYRCQMCDYWRLAHYKEEMTIAEWQAALSSLKAFIGEYAIQFVGGEPFIKKGFVSLLRFCAENRIRAGVISNGSCFTTRVAAETVAARPLNIDISVDGPRPEVHDGIRGMPGSLEQIMRGIDNLLGERVRQKHEFPIRIKSTINALNYRTMPELVDWTIRVGATSIDFEPLRRWTPETDEHLWIRDDAVEELGREIDAVVALKQGGAPIETSEPKLRNFPAHFRGERVAPALATCRVGLRDFHIKCDGNVEVCWNFPPIGNVKHQTAREIWWGPEAQKIRRETVACTVGCAYSCLAHRPLTDNLKRGLMLIKRLNQDA